MGEWIVGYDGSKGSEAALAWAVATARVAGDGVRLVTVVDADTPAGVEGLGGAAGAISSMDDATELLGDAVAPYADAGVALATEPIPGTTVAGTLVARAEDTCGLVVGTRGLGALRRMLAGSVSRAVVDRAAGAVVVVPAIAAEAPRNAVVVGADGSAGSQAAVGAAARMARLWDAELEAVTVQPAPDVTGDELPARSAMDAYLWSGMPSWSVSALGARVDSERERVLAHWRSAGEQRIDRQLRRLDPAALPDKVSLNVVKGRHPGPELVEAAEWASLLVVGRSGRTGLPGMLLGSVSRHCALHAPCPVMIVP